MKRRIALRQLAAVSTGVAFLPACKFSSASPYPNIPINTDQHLTIADISSCILPKEDLPVTTPEQTLDFILTMVNDCANPEQREMFAKGLNRFEEQVKSEFGKSFGKMDETDALEFITNILQSETSDDQIQFLLQTIRRYSIQHFTGSEYYLVNHAEYEMAPGFYHGCVDM